MTQEERAAGKAGKQAGEDSSRAVLQFGDSSRLLPNAPLRRHAFRISSFTASPREKQLSDLRISLIVSDLAAACT